MKTRFLAAAVCCLALSSFAQTSAPSRPATDKVVATINGETITQSKLDQLYSAMNPQMRAQYDQNGGKRAFLDNYVAKHLIVQQAVRSGFDKKPNVQTAMEAARESALFDLYVREVVSNQLVTDAAVFQYYQDHGAEFHTPEAVKARHILIMTNGAGPHPKTKEDAEAQIKKIAAELRGADLKAFDAAARKYSEDSTATAGGDLGWISRGKTDATFEQMAFALPNNTVSPVVESRYGYHLIFVEDHKLPDTTPFEEVKSQIRSKLLTEKMNDMMQTVAKLSSDLRASGKVSVHPENIR